MAGDAFCHRLKTQPHICDLAIWANFGPENFESWAHWSFRWFQKGECPKSATSMWRMNERWWDYQNLRESNDKKSIKFQLLGSKIGNIKTWISLRCGDFATDTSAFSKTCGSFFVAWGESVAVGMRRGSWDPTRFRLLGRGSEEICGGVAQAAEIAFRWFGNMVTPKSSILIHFDFNVIFHLGIPPFQETCICGWSTMVNWCEFYFLMVLQLLRLWNIYICAMGEVLATTLSQTWSEVDDGLWPFNIFDVRWKMGQPTHTDHGAMEFWALGRVNQEKVWNRGGLSQQIWGKPGKVISS